MVFIRRLLGEGAEGKDGVARPSCKLRRPLRAGSEVWQAQASLWAEQRSEEVMGCGLPWASQAAAMRGSEHRGEAGVLVGRRLVGSQPHSGPGPAYQSWSGWAAGCHQAGRQRTLRTGAG